ncbi:aquaporin [Catenulispora sp. NF23]|uniref:MIP/aquaporin family protein n=1 Tax=Catenulispora pinistramenti TaxID=2705254 RepID=UPI001BAB2C48|nr:aquaporin [Catenulispora pinistramenti]MBS2539586.1 aquaporin [Catenulispora pinistramenti]
MSSETVRAPGSSTSVLDQVEGGWRSLVAEFVGTMLLVLLAVGTAIFAGKFVGDIGIALAFGFTLLALVYMIGPVSGCHVNPAVTLGMVLARRMTPIAGALYWVAQFAGGIIGALLLHWIASSVRDPLGGGPFLRKSFGSPGWGKDSDLFISASGAFLVEILLTAVLVLVVLGTTHGKGDKPVAGIAIGASLTAIHLIGIPLTGTSVNPARALGPALFADNNALSQTWLFIVAPLCGAIVAVAIHWLVHGEPESAHPEPGRPDPGRPDPGRPEPVGGPAV